MEKLINNLDNFADSTIKNSILGKPFSAFHGSLKVNLNIQELFLKLLLLMPYIILCSLPLPFFANNRLGIGIIIAISLIIIFINLAINRNLQISFNTLDFTIIIFYLGIIISTFNSYFLKESLIGLGKYSLLIISYFLFRVILYNTSNKEAEKLLIIQTVIATLISLFGIYQYFTGTPQLATWEDISFGDIHTRVYSTLGNPNLLAGYLLIYLPTALYLSLKKYNSVFYNLMLLISSFLILTCISFTGSRGAYIGLGAGILVLSSLFIIKAKKYTPFIITILIFTICLLFTFPIFRERIVTIFSPWDYSSNIFRLNVWSACYEMLKDNFIFGVGPGNIAFERAYGLYMKSEFYALGAYNIFLEIAIQCGIISFLAFISILIASLSKLHILFWLKKQRFAIAIFLSIILVMTHGIFDTIFFRPQVMIPFWFLLAYIAKLEQDERGK